MNIIQKLTKGCTGDCSIVEGSGTTTLLSWEPTYDKNGNLKGGDPNIRTTFYSCGFCGLRWEVKSCMGNVTINPPVNN